MPREDAIRLVGQVVEVMSDRLCRVELSNGHRLLAHASRRLVSELASGSALSGSALSGSALSGSALSGSALTWIAVGARVAVELSPFDMSTGRLLSVETTVRTSVKTN